MSNLDQKDMDRWFKILSDEQRAELLKVQIVEGEVTKRQAIQADLEYKQSENYSLIRVGFFVLLAIIAACATCVGYELAEKPSPAPASSTSASAAP